MKWDWLHKLLDCEPEPDSSAQKQHIERRIEVAREASQQADSQLEQSQKLRRESQFVGKTAKRVRAENNFTARVRRALEGQ